MTCSMSVRRAIVPCANGGDGNTACISRHDYRAIQMNLSSDRGTFSVVEDDCVEMRGKI